MKWRRREQRRSFLRRRPDGDAVLRRPIDQTICTQYNLHISFTTLVAPRGRRRKDRSGEAIANPRPIQRLRLLPGENTRGICRDLALPTLGGVAFCNRWHLGYACFGDFPRAASHIHPPVSVVDEVAAALTVERASDPAHTAQA